MLKSSLRAWVRLRYIFDDFNVLRGFAKKVNIPFVMFGLLHKHYDLWSSCPSKFLWSVTVGKLPRFLMLYCVNYLIFNLWGVGILQQWKQGNTCLQILKKTAYQRRSFCVYSRSILNGPWIFLPLNTLIGSNRELDEEESLKKLKEQKTTGIKMKKRWIH